MKMVGCKVCSKIEGIKKLVMFKLYFLIKHSRVKKCTMMAKLGVAIGAYFSNPTNAHVKNEKLCIHTARYNYYSSCKCRKG